MMEPHDYALLFPPMAGEEFEELKRSIAEQGLLEPIVVFEDKVLDGVNRQRACSETGVVPVYREYDGVDPLGFVIARNLHRRQLTTAQRTDVALNLLPYYEERAKQRQQAHGNTAPGKKTLKDSSPEVSKGVSSQATDEAGAAVGVSGRTIRRGKNIKENDPDLYQEVVEGKTSLGAADTKVRERKRSEPRSQSEPKPERKKYAKNIDGKTNPTRERQARELKKLENAIEFNRLRYRIAQLCSAIEATNVMEDLEWDEVTIRYVADFQDDLTNMARWLDSAQHRTNAWLGDGPIREKIKIMRDPTGRTPEEAAVAKKLADRLERKLEAKLTAV